MMVWALLAGIVVGAGILVAGILVGTSWSRSTLEAGQATMNAAIAVQSATEQMLAAHRQAAAATSSPGIRQLRKLVAKAMLESQQTRAETRAARSEILRAVTRIHPRQWAPERKPGSSTSRRPTMSTPPLQPTAMDILSGPAWGTSEPEHETARALHTPSG